MAKGRKHRRILLNESEPYIVMSIYVQLNWQIVVSYLLKNVLNFPEESVYLPVQNFPRNKSLK